MPGYVFWFALVMSQASAATPSGYTDAVVDPSWEALVWEDNMLLAGNPTVLVSPDGKMLLAAIGTTASPPKASVSERLTARRIAETQAKASIARFIGSTIETTSILDVQRTTSTNANDEARIQRVTEVRRTFHELTIERAQQALHGVQVIGSWANEGVVAVLVGVEVPKP